MIERVLVFLKNQLSSYLSLKTGENDKISLVNLTDKSGKTLIDGLGMTLINVEEERILRNQEVYQQNTAGRFEKVNPELHLNLYLLFTANFGDKESDYRESLKFISYVATFFQSRNVFTPGSYPELEEGIKKLVAELFNLSFEAQNNLWASLGAKYMPSLVYKVRMISLQEKEVSREAPPITEVNLND